MSVGILLVRLLRPHRVERGHRQLREQIIIWNTTFIILNTKFIILTTNLYLPELLQPQDFGHQLRHCELGAVEEGLVAVEVGAGRSRRPVLRGLGSPGEAECLAHPGVVAVFRVCQVIVVVAVA